MSPEKLGGAGIWPDRHFLGCCCPEPRRPRRLLEEVWESEPSIESLEPPLPLSLGSRAKSYVSLRSATEASSAKSAWPGTSAPMSP